MHHAAMVSYLGNISAIGSPVKSATQPSGETNSRIAVNIGFGPVSNQWRVPAGTLRSEEHTSELQSLMRISYAVFCLKKKKHTMPILQQTRSLNLLREETIVYE